MSLALEIKMFAGENRLFSNSHVSQIVTKCEF